MTALAAVLGVLLLLALLPVGVRAVYSQTLTVQLTALGIRFRIYPGREKKEKASKKKTSKVTKPRKALPLQNYTALAVKLLEHLRRKLTLQSLTLYAFCGGSDAALNYGRGWAAVGILLPMLQNCFRIKKQDVQVFASDEEAPLRLYAAGHATLLIWQFLAIALHALQGNIKTQKKSGKGGAMTCPIPSAK